MEHIIRCPCCGEIFKIFLQDNGESIVFFDIQDNSEEMQKFLSENKIEFGVKGGEIGG